MRDIRPGDLLQNDVFIVMALRPLTAWERGTGDDWLCQRVIWDGYTVVCDVGQETRLWLNDGWTVVSRAR